MRPRVARLEDSSSIGSHNTGAGRLPRSKATRANHRVDLDHGLLLIPVIALSGILSWRRQGETVRSLFPADYLKRGRQKRS